MPVTKLGVMEGGVVDKKEREPGSHFSKNNNKTKFGTMSSIMYMQDIC